VLTFAEATLLAHFGIWNRAREALFVVADSSIRLVAVFGVIIQALNVVFIVCEV
jgi:hypothetical protein